ncbi:MAG: RNA polymerase sigma-70 factor [Robiginitomaculum sp.]|nr:MAG: RNA polymerase sigma-70 factor [Robiginitomaculum sp.]
MTGTHSASGPQHPPYDPDADILLKLARGQSSALGELMDRHLAAIKSCAWHMVGDEMIAEDIAQEVFIKAWKQAPNWQVGKAKFSTWLYRVTKNLCYDRLRKKTEIYPEILPDMVDDGPLANKMIELKQTSTAQKSRVEQAMTQLPERQRMAITLCHYRELPQIEAAEIMEIGVRAYESLLARGRKNLRAQLQRHKQELLEG